MPLTLPSALAAGWAGTALLIQQAFGEASQPENPNQAAASLRKVSVTCEYKSRVSGTSPLSHAVPARHTRPLVLASTSTFDIDDTPAFAVLCRPGTLGAICLPRSPAPSSAQWPTPTCDAEPCPASSTINRRTCGAAEPAYSAETE